MKRASTLVLRLAVILIGLGVFMMSILFLPQIARLAAFLFPDLSVMPHLVLGQLILTAIPFYYALFQALALLGLIDRQAAFSKFSVLRLRNIKKAAILISILYTLASPLYYMIADRDDAPGILLIVLIVLFAAFAVGVFAAVLETLLQDAIRIKAENDLTV